MVTEDDFGTLISEALYSDDDAIEVIDCIDSFRNSGLMTGNSGLVVTCQDGSEYQVTIRQSRFPKA